MVADVLANVSVFARTFLDDTTAAAALTTLGVSSDWQTALAQTPTGSYTPTLTMVSNLDARTAYTTHYHQVGSLVFLGGTFDADATAGSTATELGISLPVASNFTSTRQAFGTFGIGAGTVFGIIIADATNDRLAAKWSSPGTANFSYWFHCVYVVL